MHKFAPASKHEPTVFGAARPGYSDEQVNQWLQFMQNQQVQHVCCLLAQVQLARYSDLLGTYQKTFGPNGVCWAPIEDFQLVDRHTLLEKILPFLSDVDQKGEKVVVHCSGGIGRTGQVLAAWLVSARGFSNSSAIAAVRQTGRNPYEAAIAAPLKGRSPWSVAAELNQLLDGCRRQGGTDGN